MLKSEALPENKMHKILYPIPARTNLVLINKKRTCHLVDFAVPADHKVKMKENEKTNFDNRRSCGA